MQSWWYIILCGLSWSQPYILSQLAWTLYLGLLGNIPGGSESLLTPLTPVPVIELTFSSSFFHFRWYKVRCTLFNQQSVNGSSYRYVIRWRLVCQQERRCDSRRSSELRGKMTKLQGNVAEVFIFLSVLWLWYYDSLHIVTHSCNCTLEFPVMQYVRWKL